MSYGHHYTTQGESTLGLIPLGYAEGIPRTASGVVEVLARGKRWHIAGTVCMDLSVLDFGAEPLRPATRWCCSARATPVSPRPSSGRTRWARFPTRS